ncbi:hypothetical protein F5Y16DRAFT_403712 [Xylariaceae sp. FL0255]|nr:hypothetical protein F5Y16DRAFT_403712 [Xylariaceae sp. FL0255]
MLLVASLLYMFASIIFYGVVTLRRPSDVACVKVLFPRSVAQEAIEYEWKNFRDYYSPKSIHRGPPTAEREAHWDSLAHFGLIRDADAYTVASPDGTSEARELMTPEPRDHERFIVLGGVMNMHCLVG